MLISVIIPVYNIEKYVKKCLESIIGQTYSDLEILVIDDGSKDNSGKICDNFAKNDKRIKVFHKKNGGLSEARNFGIEKSNGRLIVLVDGDDYVKPDYIKEMYEAIRQSGADIAVCGYNEFLRKGVVSGESAAALLLVEQENYDIVAWNKMYKRELFIKNDIRYPKGKRYEDCLTTYKLLAKAKNVIYIPKELYYYVERSGSIMSVSKIEDRLKIREVAAIEAVEYFKNSPDLKDAAEVSVLTAKFAFVDAGIKKQIDAGVKNANMKWIINNRRKYDNNRFLTKKLKLYLCLSRVFNGGGYYAFRKLFH